MANLSLQPTVDELLEQWVQAERRGEKFPVPLHDHWSIAGHKKPQDAFALLESRQEEGFDYLRSTVKTSGSKGGRPRQARFLSVAALERFCLAAHTHEGDAVRELYRQAKSKWELTQLLAPKLAEDVELLHLQIELAKIEAQKESAIAQAKQTDLQLTQFRHLVATTLPEPIQQKILGYQEIKTVEYVDRTITPEGESFDGVGITYIQKRYGFKTTKAAWDWLESIGCGKQSGHWESQLAAVERQSLPRDLVPRLDQLAQSGNRQRFLGELP